MSRFLSKYRSFQDLEFAKNIGEILDQNGIPYIIEEDVSNLDASFGNHPLNKDYFLKLDSGDFARANIVISDFFKQHAESIEKDHFLYDFGEDELLEVIAKPDEWGELNYHLAQKILKEKGTEIPVTQLKIYEKQRIEELSQPEKTDYSTVILGYIFTFLYPAAFFLGYILYYSKKTLPTGQRVYAYSPAQRFHGKIILIVSSILFLLLIISILYKNLGH